MYQRKGRREKERKEGAKDKQTPLKTYKQTDT